MERYFDINKDGCSIRCLLYRDPERPIRRVVVYGHGFGGHKETRAAARFAQTVLSKHRDTATLCFDWPCHGADARKKLSLDDCDRYLRLVTEHAREVLGAEELLGYATSFGGYLYLKYLSEHPSPFRRVALRSPAVGMIDVLTSAILDEEAQRQLERGKEVEAGFDRKIRIGRPFLESLREADIRRRDFLELAEDLFIVHGTKDEIVPFEMVRSFADEQLIEMLPVEGADHRFLDPHRMELAIKAVLAFFWP
ncbi:MAG: alpha/beta fold hydrolase [Oscillospiraceae bacterium]|nr:alpha/beta fold hydrolase [Oscillospiraceae bacterium]